MQEDLNKISINARLRASVEEIKKSISALPNMQLLKNSNPPIYNIFENVNGKAQAHAEITFRSDSIIITGTTTVNSGISKTILLIKFLSVLAYIKQYYDFDIFELYPNIIDALQSSIFFEKHLNSNMKIERLIKQVDALNLSNIKLSEEIVGIRKLNSDNLNILALFREFFIHISESLKINSSIKEAKLAESLSSFGISADVYNKLAKFSYKIKSEE